MDCFHEMEGFIEVKIVEQELLSKVQALVAFILRSIPGDKVSNKKEIQNYAKGSYCSKLLTNESPDKVVENLIQKLTERGQMKNDDFADLKFFNACSEELESRFSA